MANCVFKKKNQHKDVKNIFMQTFILLKILIFNSLSILIDLLKVKNNKMIKRYFFSFSLKSFLTVKIYYKL